MMAERLKILLWGTADFGKPRSRILRQGLQEEGVLVGECVIDVWDRVDDKSQVKGLWAHLRLIIKWVCAYPILVWKYLRAPRHDMVFVAYLGHFDVLVLWPFAKMRGATIVWDAFLSLYDTIVCDRRLVPTGSLRAWCIKQFERLVCAAADVIVLDTVAHADYFKTQYSIPNNKFVSAFVGAEVDIFQAQNISKRNQIAGKCRVLFYGQFIPLHGIEFIIEAARLTKDPSIEWVIIGRGQETDKIQTIMKNDNISSVTFMDWVEYEQLPEVIDHVLKVKEHEKEEVGGG